ncbi:hypothetical protein AGMMS49545_02370 [Betaproteobacteria bacterium]|nr:hypothetical protein AGMMS49545_02370 [Betaproteobacteria bacterium]GHU40552.1 hypothetical protein AGMMS50289_02250 [Betaproteobacteria bacterium]
MNVVYNSPHYSVLSYPAQEGFELLDKGARRILFLQGVCAHHFRDAINDIPEKERTEEAIDAFLDDYCVGGEAQPIVFH